MELKDLSNSTEKVTDTGNGIPEQTRSPLAGRALNLHGLDIGRHTQRYPYCRVHCPGQPCPVCIHLDCDRPVQTNTDALM